MRFRNIILAYFVIGAFMYGAGVIDWSNAGISNVFVENTDSGIAPNSTAAENVNRNLNNTGGSITGLIDTFGGPILIIWNLIDGLLGYIHWPVVALATNNAPPRLVLMLGGGLVVGFYMSLVGLVMSGS